MFNPSDFLTFSQDLLSPGGIRQNEALCRSAISRAYYSAFLSAREKIDTLDSSILDHTKYDMHKQVTEALFLLRFRRQERWLSNELYQLKKYRLDADYRFVSACDLEEHCKMSNPNIKSTAITCINLANYVIGRINTLL